ncbi:hypothetical protein T01_4179 [Trichinella spiralis]|uniref:Uncharacterized protein n=1 Tax=Trichinella spiralis TaxID=6334 RepID=A0A0V1AIA9_TRISP|nr:hypothetical protein T01_4179 [Trichinella spiralis]
MECGEEDFSQIAVYKGIRQASWIKKHVIVTVDGTEAVERKCSRGGFCKIVFANHVTYFLLG